MMTSLIQNSTKSHSYFDFSWDISRKYENLHTRKRQLARHLARAVQKNALLRKQLGLPKNLVSDPSDSMTTVFEGVPTASVHKDAFIEDVVSEGAISDKSWTCPRKRTTKHQPSKRARLSEGVLRTATPASTPQRDPSPADPSAGPSHELYIRHSEVTKKGTDPVTPLQIPPASPIFPAGHLMHIISNGTSWTMAQTSTVTTMYLTRSSLEPAHKKTLISSHDCAC
jgi:hypothetical protein